MNVSKDAENCALLIGCVKQYEFLKNLNIKILEDLGITLLTIYPKELKMGSPSGGISHQYSQKPYSQ